MSDTDAAFAAAFSGDPLSPAMVAEDGRGTVTMLNEARDQATVAAENLERLEAAGAGLARVQQLVGRLRDVAVVAVDRGLQPADRAALQRQVDLALSEIDTVADETMVDDSLLHKGGSAASGSPADSGGERLAPFRAIGTGALGIAGLAVRSSDQAIAAAGALEVATARLERSAGALGRATARLHDALNGLIAPTTTATGERAIDSSTAAISTTMLLRAQLMGSPQEAIQAQAVLDVSRVRWLLDSSAR
jgi:flagellin-like hook-associated protein FlgL